MKDMRKFKKLTRPVPFRKSKLYFKYAKEKVAYYLCNILYNIKILKRFTYNDIIERSTNDKGRNIGLIESNIVTGDLIMFVKERVIISQDWFYFRDRNNHLLTIEDIEETHAVLHMFLDRDSIKVKVSNSWFHFNVPYPQVRVLLEEPIVKVVDENVFEEGYDMPRNTIAEYTLDLTRLFNLRNSRILKCKIGEIGTSEYEYYTDLLKKEFVKHLNTLTIQDLEM